MSNPRLPRGKVNDLVSWGYSDDYSDDEKKKYEPTDLTKTCDCGVEITYGPNAPKEFHLDYCKLYVPRLK